MSIQFRPGDTFKDIFVITGLTGAAVNADNTPTITVVRGTALDGSVVPTVSNLTTGLYALSFVIPSGYAVGEIVNYSINATVGGIVTKGKGDPFRLVGYPQDVLPNISVGSGGQVATADNAGRVTVAPGGLDGILYGSANLRQMIICTFEASIASKINGAAAGTSGTAHIRDFLDAINRATINYDANGNRTSVAVTLPP